MFDWVLNTSLNTITTLFLDVSKLKLMTFRIFFQQLIFPSNTRSRLRCIQNPVVFTTSAMELFRELCCCCCCCCYKIHKKTTVPESLFYKVIGFYPATSIKKGLQYRCFLMNFAKYVRHLFYGTPLGDSFCSTKKYFTNKIIKKSLRKEKNGNSLQKKQRYTQNKNLTTIYIKSSHPFTIKIFFLFLFSLLPMIY